MVKEISRWNNMVAGVYGGLKDAMQEAGGNAAALQCEIAKFPNFEHLEAKGRIEKDRE